ncbi:hypothetical protein ISF_07764 [Cordyceps fumosorosea ARSEF 2679]|uniref:Uncharacterized protein n=1 Tax=Cordyceps fumosorosea (strain ARSEF 2679) TaxID=1081104 RepID=A0A167NKT1_CORFA|nr:hypothetical protein ISF_07764 [Cordyceps fumosorosea ARSEF 2679]OAA55659.1 hypothetical protein ISF_07764 [Cordyceps fumosorosea ARSEF 2679]
MAGPQDASGPPLPPPSTLAAQLVETISASSRVSSSSSSRSADDSAELKALFAVIQRVKDRPELLGTPAQRLEHNHMLVYVYCRVVLDAVRLDDPLLDVARVRAEALRALTFLRFTVNETPSALSFSSADHGLLLRGGEPLWAWLLPRWLRMLGHPRCEELRGAIEGFLQYLLLTVARVSKLWPVIGPLTLYLRGCLTGLIEKLQSPPSKRNASIDIEMPPPHVLDQALQGRSPPPASVSLTYRIKLPRQALQQAHSLARVLAYPLTCRDPAFASVAPMSEIGPWLLDAWLDLWSAQKRLPGDEKKSPLPLIEMAVDVAKASATAEHAVVAATRNKACTTLVLLCSEMVAAPEELAESDDAGAAARASYCLALVAIAQAALQSPTIGRLAASKLVNELSLLPAQYPALGEETDVWRCALLLREVVNLEPPQTLPSSTHPSLFQDTELRRCVEGMHLSHEQPTGHGNGAKRRKLNESSEMDTVSHAIKRLRAALELDEPLNEEQFDSARVL